MNKPLKKGLSSLMNPASIPVTFYIDMDGTLAEYKRVDIRTLYEPMYFAKLRPNENVIKGIQNLISSHPEISVQVLSCVLADRPGAVEEKMDWLKRHCPFLLTCTPCFIPCGANKGSIAKEGGINVLLDDHSPNLIEFSEKENCIGIKLLNGINGAGKKWQGATISKDLRPEEFAKSLYELISNEKAKTERRTA